MISFKRLGTYGRLGNQLFQYAFLRTTAERLRVKFYCPEWLGDKIFQLNDNNERARECGQINKEYESLAHCGFHKGALHIEDGTDIIGCFQSEKYFERDKVRQWFTFKDSVIIPVREKYAHINFAESTGVHLRFGDMRSHPMFMVLSKKYYARALTKTLQHKNIVVFSDEIETAKGYLDGIAGNFIFIEGNKDYEELYLMTLCHDFVCSMSTFSWWGAYLNNFPEKIIVSPTRGLRPGSPVQCSSFYCQGWIPLRAYRLILDDFRFIVWRQRLLKLRTRSFLENLRSLMNFLRNKIKL